MGAHVETSVGLEQRRPAGPTLFAIGGRDQQGFVIREALDQVQTVRKRAKRELRTLWLVLQELDQLLFGKPLRLRRRVQQIEQKDRDWFIFVTELIIRKDIWGKRWIGGRYLLHCGGITCIRRIANELMKVIDPLHLSIFLELKLLWGESFNRMAL